MYLSLSLSLSFSLPLFLSILFLSFSLSLSRTPGLDRDRACVSVPPEFVNSFGFGLAAAYAFRLVCEAFVTGVGDVRIARAYACRAYASSLEARVPPARHACLSMGPSFVVAPHVRLSSREAAISLSLSLSLSVTHAHTRALAQREISLLRFSRKVRRI